MQSVLLTIHVLLALALIGLVLVQRSEQDGFGLSGGGNSVFSGRSTANFLSRSTAIVATLFLSTSMVLAVLSSRSSDTGLLQTIEQTGPVTPAKPAQPKTPAVPFAQ
jgi:preprotein translocase subunit SecG